MQDNLVRWQIIYVHIPQLQYILQSCVFVSHGFFFTIFHPCPNSPAYRGIKDLLPKMHLGRVHPQLSLLSTWEMWPCQTLQKTWAEKENTWNHGDTMTLAQRSFFQSVFLGNVVICYDMSNGLNLLHPRKDVAEMVIIVCVSLIVPQDLLCVIKSGKHVYQKSSFFVSSLSFLRVSW